MPQTFKFKQFHIFHDKSSMKVGTDAVLLAALVEMSECNSILDIGCGSGVISLMCAQKSKAEISAIDIDQNSVEQAHENFESSKWKSRFTATECSLQEYAKLSEHKFDLLISNPPFFENALKSPLETRNKARHNDTLSSEDLLTSAHRLLNTHGKLALILPFSEGKEFIKIASSHQFYLQRRVEIQPKASKIANRLVLEFVLSPCETTKENIIIREEGNDYTEEYRCVTKDFYLAF